MESGWEGGGERKDLEPFFVPFLGLGQLIHIPQVPLRIGVPVLGLWWWCFRLRDGFEQQDGAKAIHILTVPLKKRRNVSGNGKDPGLGMYQEFAAEGRAERA